MGGFHRDFRRFTRRIALRRASYWALWALALSLLVVAAAPWLTLDFNLVIALPVLVPAAAALMALASRPSAQVSAQLADYWTRGAGSVVAAWELPAQDPFRPEVEQQALASLRAGRIPAPRALRYALASLVVLAALLPLSRLAYAAWSTPKPLSVDTDNSCKPSVSPEHAAELARSAGRTAEKAKSLGAKGQEKLADRIEDAARRAQAGADDKEHALRNANALVDKAREETRGQQERGQARDALREIEAAAALARAAESTRPDAVENAAQEAADPLFNDGVLDKARAAQLREAMRRASDAAPHDPFLRHAAAEAMEQLSPERLAGAEKQLQAKRDELKSQGASNEKIAKELRRAEQEANKELRESLQELARAAHMLRDLDPDGNLAKGMLESLLKDGVGAEQLKKMIEQAQGMSRELQIDAETLREMLKQGKQFPGLEEHARQLLEKALKEGKPIDPASVPDWGKGGIEGHKANKDPAGGGAHAGPDEGKEAAVDVSPTGDGPRDPDKPEKLDPTKAGGETSRIKPTGARATGGGADTAEEVERLPRRYRDAARKYFDR